MRIEVTDINSLCEVVKDPKIKFRHMALIVKFTTGTQIKFTDSRNTIVEKLKQQYEKGQLKIIREYKV